MAEEQDQNRRRWTGICGNRACIHRRDRAPCDAQALYRAFKIVVDELGMSEVRFHDLRHSYAVASIRAGDDIKTVQENIGHATAAFSLDVYGHVTDQMKRDSVNRMQKYIQNVSR